MAWLPYGYVCHRLVPLRLAVDGCYAVVYVADNRIADAELQGVRRAESYARAGNISGGVTCLRLSLDVAFLGGGYVADGLCVGDVVYDSRYL